MIEFCGKIIPQLIMAGENEACNLHIRNESQMRDHLQKANAILSILSPRQ